MQTNMIENKNNNIINDKAIALAKDAEMKALEAEYARQMFE